MFLDATDNDPPEFEYLCKRMTICPSQWGRRVKLTIRPSSCGVRLKLTAPRVCRWSARGGMLMMLAPMMRAAAGLVLRMPMPRLQVHVLAPTS